MTNRRERLLLVAYWIAPSLFCLALYWIALNTWFTQDDFVWLDQLKRIHGWGDLWHALFDPTVHGTFRPLSERAYFLALQAMFGLDPLPFRIVLFATISANLVLLCSIARKLTGSRMAGFLAPVLWIASADLALVIAWASAYMQALCCLCLLLPFRFLLEYVETGERRYYWFQWAVFLTGFLVLESEMMYPALAASYLLLRARKQILSTIPMFAVSAAYAAAHLLLAKPATVGPYAMHFDASVAGTLLAYWNLALAPVGNLAFTKLPRILTGAIVPILTMAILGFAAMRLRRRDWLPVVFLSWFVILLVPVLPLRDHITPYILTLPLTGLAMLGAYAAASAWNGPGYQRALGVAMTVLYLSNTIPGARAGVRDRYEEARRVRQIVLGVARAHELHPGKTILLTGIDNTLYWSAIHNGSFDVVGVPDVYLAPGTDRLIQVMPGSEGPSERVLDAAAVNWALAHDEMEVYEVGGPRLKNITNRYAFRAAAVKDEQPRKVGAAVAIQSGQFGKGWYAAEGAWRWMSQRATVKIAGPRSAAERLYIRGGCVPAQTRNGPLKLTVAADGRPLGTREIRDCSDDVAFDYAFPADLIGKDAVLLTLEVDRTYQLPPDQRSFGLYFRWFEVR